MVRLGPALIVLDVLGPYETFERLWLRIVESLTHVEDPRSGLDLTPRSVLEFGSV